MCVLAVFELGRLVTKLKVFEPATMPNGPTDGSPLADVNISMYCTEPSALENISLNTQRWCEACALEAAKSPRVVARTRK
jgi:hypothetical protein